MIETDQTINSAYSQKNILITGGTGFFGKVIIEKLLFSCSEVKTIFVLIRKKYGKSEEERFTSFKCDRIFSRVKASFPHRLEKLKLLTGNISSPLLGLSPHDLKLILDQVNVVIHVAATVKFNEPIETAFNLNVNGTHQTLTVARQIKNLECFCHISTAYYFPSTKHVEECVKDFPLLLDRLNLKNGSVILEDDFKTKLYELIGSGKLYPNTYAFTKHLAEILIQQAAANDSLPCLIIRPSIICAAVNEPFPGWIDNFNGATGLICEAGRGTLRSMIGESSFICDLIPVDLATNLLIVAVSECLFNFNLRSSNLSVINCTIDSRNLITWSQLTEYVVLAGIKYPSMFTFLKPGTTFRRNVMIHNVMVLLFHYLPALAYDIIKGIFRKKFNFQMFGIAKKLNESMNSVSYFTTNEWLFEDTKQLQLLKFLKNMQDDDHFKFSSATLNWKTYFEIYVLGIRTYLLKDDIRTLENARTRLRKIHLLQSIFITVGTLVLVMGLVLVLFV